MRLYKSELEAPAALHVNFAAFLRSHLSRLETRRGGGTDAADDEVKVTRQNRTADFFMNAFFIPYLLFLIIIFGFATLSFAPPCHARTPAGVAAAQPPAPGGPGPGPGSDPPEPRSTTQVTLTELSLCCSGPNSGNPVQSGGFFGLGF